MTSRFIHVTSASVMRPTGGTHSTARNFTCTLMHRINGVRRSTLLNSASKSRKNSSTVIAAAASNSSAAAGSSDVAVSFQVQYKTDFGQSLKVVGQGEALGNWNTNAAPVMDWNEGDIWTLNLHLSPASPVEFKFVIAAPDAAIWEEGPNRSLSLPLDNSPTTTQYRVSCDWGSSETELSAEPISEEVKEVGKMTITNNPAATTAVATEVGKMTIESNPEIAKISEENKEREELAVKEVGKMQILTGSDNVVQDLVESGVGAEEGLHDAEAMLPSLSDSLDEDQLESPLSDMLSGFLRGLGLGGSSNPKRGGPTRALLLEGRSSSSFPITTLAASKFVGIAGIAAAMVISSNSSSNAAESTFFRSSRW